MSISKITLIICIWIVFAITSCSLTKGHEYYLDKDEAHRDVYKITASINSEGTCGFSIGENESYEGLKWNDPNENMKRVDRYFEFGGFCEQEPSTNLSKYIYIPTVMFLDAYIPTNTNKAALKSGLLLDVFAPETLTQFDNPAGVHFSIHQPQSVKRPKRFVCLLGVSSLRGEAHLRYRPDGVVELEVSALAYTDDMGCF